MLDKLLIFFRWIGFGSLIAISFRFISFLVGILQNPYVNNTFNASDFFVDLAAAVCIVALDYFYRQKFQKANPNASLGSLFFRHFSFLSVWVALFICLTAYIDLWRADEAFFLGYRPLFYDVLTGWFLTAIYVVGVTGRFILNRWRQSLFEVERYKKENLQVRLETLRAQINPHFLFNSLNTLSGLIHENPDRASQFLRRISQVYRHVLEIRDRETVSLRDELQFEENEKGTYTLTIPRVNYRFSYKIHRGSWATVESDAQGNDISNRSFLQGSEDTLQLVVEGWLDVHK